ncbi:helix-turn-helix domain-containing protein [Paracoccus sp. PAR01]|uniref:helix-turn-helix transcriptional regulator n=1 Tax=Paracoccus sp. PAR01 TaxID=2769282 RepID=UPI00177E056B|nr:helix-turn-helix domain-containing protein [Paracoccus sp. PAR01]MBD9527341.1 helix-turn-helix domain-containing protein [Paracoccus sp. PAR01]
MPQFADTANHAPINVQTGYWSYTARSYSDFTVQERGLEGFEQRYRQISKGTFAGRIESLIAGDLCLSRERSNRAMENEFRFPDNVMCVALPVGPNSHGTGSFGSLHPGGAIMPPAGRDNRAYLREGMDLLIVSLPVEPEIHSASIGLEYRGATFTSWLCTVLDIAREGYARDDLMRILPDLIRDHLSLLGPASSSERGSSRRDFAIFDEIVAACERLMPEDLTVSGLSARLDRSRAELRKACLALTETRLDDLLAAWRMNDVYRTLRTNPDKQSIGEIALDYGYMHAGRFSLAFREMFGMRPKDARDSI